MKKILTLLVAVLCLASFNTVHAKAFYTNSKGTEFTQEQFEKAIKHYNRISLEILSQENLDSDIKSDFKDIKTINKYFTVNTLYDKSGKVISSFDKEISEDEYNNFQYNVYSLNSSTEIETTAKKLVLEITKSSNSDFVYYINSVLIWKTIPKVKSFDVYAMRFDNNLSILNYEGLQVMNLDQSNEQITNYAEGGTNSKKFGEQGFGISMNVYDDAKNSLGMAISAKVLSFSRVNAFVSYQHATSGVTLAQSQDYTLSSSGLGNVIKFNSSTIKSRYDGMQGVNLTY